MTQTSGRARATAKAAGGICSRAASLVGHDAIASLRSSFLALNQIPLRPDHRNQWVLTLARDPDAALRMDQRFSDAAASLADFPMLGHEGEVPGTRELTPHRSYRLVYEVVHDTVWILVLIHSARHWPLLR